MPPATGAADKLTREQWESLARFCGLEFTGMIAADTPCVQHPPESRMNEIWMPHEDWRDFGPLWLKLEVWLGDGTTPDQPLHSTTWDFECAKMEGDERQLMQTGCLLGAAIGATMKPAIAADKEN